MELPERDYTEMKALVEKLGEQANQKGTWKPIEVHWNESDYRIEPVVNGNGFLGKTMEENCPSHHTTCRVFLKVYLLNDGDDRLVGEVHSPGCSVDAVFYGLSGTQKLLLGCGGEAYQGAILLMDASEVELEHAFAAAMRWD
ncbi:MAG: hypothetical protein HXX08_11170 [Chloroflexi bacterium]|uniref:Uncharacterized protein n=1 Tax=Candidatus Chlorohelix allophototropha TaxID=3003348 RepID=A0A8T7M269_9CHLR|nr:hypothetical protein [Chloroflexota bacterium]WJW65797.1 hypothetical protein OZ401_001576 [Chloroflexota bacterium L227-S17]